MSNDSKSKSRVVLGPVATALMMSEAGDREPERGDLETAITKLIAYREQHEAEGNRTDHQQDFLKRHFEQIHMSLLDIRKLCSAGFLGQQGAVEDALLELDRHATDGQREFFQAAELEVDAFERQADGHDQDITLMRSDLKEREGEVGEKER